MSWTLRGARALRGWLCACVLAAGAVSPAMALEAQAVGGLLSEEAADKAAAVDDIAAAGDEAALGVLMALQEGVLLATPDRRLVIREGGTLRDAITGAAVEAEPDELEKITLNNRLRSHVESAVAGLRILSRDPAQRLEAARGIEPSTATLPILSKALAAETDPAIRDILRHAEAASRLQSGDNEARIQAIGVIGEKAI